VLSNGAEVTALYWQDFLVKYVSKNAQLNSAALDPNKQGAFALARSSIFWGCPEWQGRYGGTTVPDGISPYENGYSFNVWPTWKVTTPLGQHPPYAECAVDDYVQNGIPSNVQGKPPARYAKLTDYNAERALIVESNLWLFVTCGTDASRKVQPLLNCSNPGFSGAIGYNTAGYNSIDRYRHGKYPPLINGGLTFDDTKGRVSFNILYGDGHVSEAQSIAQGMRAVQMRDP
jgi:prepilin-type processing-associated H-X9-DG protein